MKAKDTILKWLGFETKPVLGELLDKYSVVDVVSGTKEHGPFVIVTERQKKSKLSGIDFVDPDPGLFSGVGGEENSSSPVVAAAGGRNAETVKLKESPNMSELGSSSPSPYTAFLRKEYNRDLQGAAGLEKYNKMRSDGVVAGSLLLFKTPVYAANWFMRPATQDPVDKLIAEFVWKCLTEYMSITWTQVKLEAMLMCEFGYYMFEKVWERRSYEDALSPIYGDSRLVLKKLAPRHPMDVKEWKYDANGGPEKVIMYTEGGNMDLDEVPIDIEKLLVFTLNREANDITGRSMLRAIYKHWYYKEQLYKIDAIQKERHGIGVPVIKLPVNFTEEDKRLANELGRNLRTNERAHVVLPPMWEVIFAKLEGQPVDAIKSIELHDKAIRESIIASFLGSDANAKEEDVSLFLKSTRFIADSICDAFNTYLIPELVRYNFGKEAKCPKLAVRRIGEQADWRVLGFAVRNFVGAGIIRPDDELERRMREELDLPPADPKTARVTQTPQVGNGAPGTPAGAKPVVANPAMTKTNGVAGNAGLPRGTPVPNAGPPGGNAGFDKGGQS